jgi:hypothetical protein
MVVLLPVAPLRLMSRTYAVEGVGEAKPPRALYFWQVTAANVAVTCQKEGMFGGPGAHTQRVPGDAKNI